MRPVSIEQSEAPKKADLPLPIKETAAPSGIEFNTKRKNRINRYGD